MDGAPTIDVESYKPRSPNARDLGHPDRFPTEMAVSHRQSGLQLSGRVAILKQLQQSGNVSCGVPLANGSGMCYSLKVAD